MRRCSSSVHGQLVCLALACSWVAAVRAQLTPRTDPIEVAALNTILGRWGKKASPEWNISGELCSGVAVDDTDIDNSPIINPGIKCDCSFNNRTVCHITKLRVYALNVVGQIPAELQNLTYLTKLDLTQNYLTGSLPAFIGELTALEYLSVAINALTGIVPRELGNLKNLIALSISLNKFVGPLPEEIQNLTKLEQLYIDSCGLSGELPSTFSKLKNLKILWASDNDFTGKIPDYIGSLSNLEVLRFEGNNFDGPIPARLSNLVKLASMRIGDLVSGSSSLAFVANMTSLDTLILRNCRISDNLASVDFSIFEQLTYLDLSFNSITGKVPPTLLNLSSLSFLFLGSNNLSGSLPDTKSPSLTTLDFSYNMLSGRFPSWVNMNYSQVNLVWNNFVIDSSNSSVLPSGLNCLQRDTPCFLGSPEYSSFAVDSGGKGPIRGSDNSIYEPDDANLQGASYYVTNSTRWGVSNIGKFMESPNASYIIHTSHQFNNTLDSELFQTARMSPSSLRYYGIGLKNGNYNVVLQFAEIFFPDTQTWKSLGRRIFDIYIQVAYSSLASVEEAASPPDSPGGLACAKQGHEEELVAKQGHEEELEEGLSLVAGPLVPSAQVAPARSKEISSRFVSGKLVTFSRRARAELQEPILPLPDVQRTLIKQATPFTPRRSKRLAAKGWKLALDDQQTHILLAGQLRLDQHKTSEDQSSQNAFLSLWDKQLSRDHVVALAALFKIVVPENLLPDAPVVQFVA